METRYGKHDLAPLFEFIRIPSISGEQEYESDVLQAAVWVADFASRMEGARVDMIGETTRPSVIARIDRDPTLPTVVVYGHFDVQPPGDSSLWLSPPCAPTIANGWSYGRGAADGKGNFVMLLEAIRSLSATNALPVNVVIVADGEEEIGGTAVGAEMNRFRDADACIIFDGPMPCTGSRCLRLPGRGLISMRVQVHTSEAEVHSGIYGDAALNAIQVLLELLQDLKTAAWMENLATPEVGEEEIREWALLPSGTKVFAENGIQPADSMASEELYKRTFATVGFDITGLSGGEPRRRRNAVPNQAQAFISIRVPPGITCKRMIKLLAETACDRTPRGTQLATEVFVATEPATIQLPTPVRTAVNAAFQSVLGIRPLVTRTGGTIPILGALGKLQIPTVLTGFDVPEGNAHAPNERLLLDYLPTGIQTAAAILQNLQAVPRVKPAKSFVRPEPATQ